VDAAAATELMTLLVGVALPAEKARLLEYAVQQRAEPTMLDALSSLSDREFESLDDVAQELARTDVAR
jgi:GTP-sensing pleiotropic transcriptional regulator CodY